MTPAEQSRLEQLELCDSYLAAYASMVPALQRLYRYQAAYWRGYRARLVERMEPQP